MATVSNPFARQPEPPSFLARLGTYLVTIVLVVGLAILAERQWGFSANRGICIGTGVMLLLAGARTPDILYHTIRYMRILGLIRDDDAARIVMVVLGLGVLALGVLGADLR